MSAATSAQSAAQDMTASSQRQFPSTVGVAILVALAVRLLVMGFLYSERLAPARDHYEFAYENGRVARAIASGKGISNPLWGETGPTAMLTPVYPGILAGIFKVFGTYTKGAAIAALSLNCILSAATCLPVFLVARKCFGDRVAKWSAWGWALSPYGIYFAADWIWPTCLTTLLLSTAFLLVLHLGETSSWQAWAGFGLLVGFAALNDAVLLSSLPLLAIWCCYRRNPRGGAWFAPALTAALAFVVVVAPWFVRNYRTFHAAIPFRSGMGLELYVGNNGYTEHWANTKIRLANNAAEFEEYKQAGEIAYMAHKKQQALQFIASHPGLTAIMAVRRAVYLWTGFWSLDRQYLAGEPLDPPNIFLATSLSVLAFAGIRRAFQEKNPYRMPFLIVLIFFPVVYYVTHPEVYYLRPLDPLIVVLAAYAVESYCARYRGLKPLAEVSDR